MTEPETETGRRSRWVRLITWAAGHQYLVAFLLVAGAFLTGIWRVESVAREAHDIALDNEAHRCVVDWERVSDIRAAIPIPGEAIIAVSPDADPERVAQFRAVVDARIRDAYPDPECSYEAARRRLAD